MHGVRRAGIGPHDRVAIIGGGNIGLCAVVATRATGASVDLVARHDAQRAAGERVGAGIIESGEASSYDVVIDAAGTTDALQQCVTLARAGARLGLLATYWDGNLQLNGFEVCMKEITVIPASQYNRVGPSRDVDTAATLLATNPSIASAIITHRYPLDAAAEAFATAADRKSGAIKVVLEP